MPNEWLGVAGRHEGLQVVAHQFKNYCARRYLPIFTRIKAIAWTGWRILSGATCPIVFVVEIELVLIIVGVS